MYNIILPSQVEARRATRESKLFELHVDAVTKAFEEAALRSGDRKAFVPQTELRHYRGDAIGAAIDRIRAAGYTVEWADGSKFLTGYSIAW